MSKVHTGSKSRMVYGMEETYGTAPSSGWKSLPFTAGETLGNDISQFTSETLRSDRMIPDIITGSHKPGGSIPFEFMMSGYVNFIKNCLMGCTNVVSDLGANTHSLSIYGAVEPTNNASAMPAIPEEGITIRKYFDASGECIPFMLEYIGCKVNGFSLNIPTDGIVTGSFDILGLQETLYTNPEEISVSEPTQKVISSLRLSKTSPWSGYIVLKESGVGPITDKIGIVQSATINVSNNMERVPSAGEILSYSIEPGQRSVSGSLVVTLTDASYYQAFLSELEKMLVLRFDLTQGSTSPYDHNKYYVEFIFPRIKLLSPDGGMRTPLISAAGPLTQEVGFTSLPYTDYPVTNDDSTVDTNIEINYCVSAASYLTF